MTYATASGRRATPRFVTANGLRFAYLESGSGPLVLLLHGFPDDAYSFDGIQPAIAAAGYRTVAPFLRGYYPSDIAADGDYSPLTIGRDVLALIDALGERDAVVVGHDWGAIAGFIAASLAPERLRRLVSIGIPHARALLPTPRQIWRARHFLYFVLPWAPRAVRRGGMRYVERLFRRWSPNWSPPAEHVERIKAAFSLPGRVEAAIDYYHDVAGTALRRSSRRVLLRPTEVPTLAIEGSEDGAVSPKTMAASAKHFRRGYRLIIVPGAGHFVHCERPAEVTGAILDWLGAPA